LVPYSAQAAELRSLLTRAACHCLVSSIDAFQGKETEVVVFCTVRTSHQLGFVDDRHRMNVLLTRARTAVIGVGSRNALMKSQLWAAWLTESPNLPIDRIQVG